MTFPTVLVPYAPEPGSLVGPWRVLDRVDSGSFGIIYRVALSSDPSTGPYAMKLAATPGGYRSPQALAFRERFALDPEAHYQARPEDDVYALGVTVYRLVTGTYPRELVQALETAGAGPQGRLDEPLLPSASVLPTEHTRFRGYWAWRARRLARAGLVLAGVTAVAVALLVAAPELLYLREGGGAPDMLLPPIAEEWHVPPGETPDAGMGDEALLSVQDVPRAGVPHSAITLPMPKKPLPGQRRPPCERGETAIHGACWGAVKDERPPCGSKMFDYEDGCYFASFDTPRQPTSGEP